MSRTYSKEMLEDCNAKKFEYNGKKMTEYEALQEQRHLERQIRRWKREQNALQAAGLDASEATAKVREWNGKHKDFLEQTGLKADGTRTVVGKGNASAKRDSFPKQNGTQSAKEKILPDIKKVYTKEDDSGIIKLLDEEQYALNSYISSESYKINDKLRTGAELTEDDNRFIADLDRALDRLPKYNGNLNRSMVFDSDEDVKKYYDSLTIDGETEFPAYTSTSKKGIYNKDGNVQIFVLNSSKGADLSGFNDAENEVLYARNSKFKVLNKNVKDGTYCILLEEV